MKIELRAVDAIKPYHRNVRVNDRAVAPVAASIREFGFRQPVVVDARGVIICGHTRWLAAKSLGLPKIPVHVARDLPPAKVRAYRLADNRLHEIATWDFAALSIEMSSLQSSGLDLTLLGFASYEIASLLEKARNPADVDEVPEPPDKAQTKPGDLWTLGSHRLLCGDSAKAADVARLTRGQKIHLFNTDPPYNVKVEPRSNNALAAAGKGTHHQRFDLHRKKRVQPTSKKLRAKDRPLANDFLPDAEFARLLAAWFRNAADVLIPGGAFYVWGGYANCANYPAALAGAQLYFSQAVIWIKEHPVMTRKDFMGNHEWCFYGWKEGAAHRWFGPRNLTDVWSFVPGRSDCGSRAIGRGVRLESAGGSRLDVLPPGSQDLPTARAGEEGVTLFGANNATDVWSVRKVTSQQSVHLTEKPVELAVRAMRYSSRPGENVLDLFGGSGSTLMAAEQNERRAYLMELDPLYCDVIVQRWENLTGKKARR
jgi:DNA modification methylase